MNFKLERSNPIVIIEGRDDRPWSREVWMAINAAYTDADICSRVIEVLEIILDSNDKEGKEIWIDPPNWIAVSHTPDLALDALLKKLAPHG